MSLAIRLARGGMKKKPYYRIVVTDSRNARDGKFIEKIGTYNPLLNKENPERGEARRRARAAHWLGVGAQPSDRGRALPSTPRACGRARRGATDEQGRPRRQGQGARRRGCREAGGARRCRRGGRRQAARAGCRSSGRSARPRPKPRSRRRTTRRRRRPLPSWPTCPPPRRRPDVDARDRDRRVARRPGDLTGGPAAHG